MAECDHEAELDELVERDEEVRNLDAANEELRDQIRDLTDERDKYKGALEEISTLSGRAL